MFLVGPTVSTQVQENRHKEKRLKKKKEEVTFMLPQQQMLALQQMLAPQQMIPQNVNGNNIKAINIKYI